MKTSSVTNKVVFLGSSMTFDSLNGSCVQEELPVDIQNAQVFNLAYPGDKMVFRLIDLEYLIDSDVDVVAIELSTVTFDRTEAIIGRHYRGETGFHDIPQRRVTG